MSLHLFSRIYRETSYTGATQTVLAILGGYADEYNYCSMSEARVMWESGLSERSVRNAIRELERDGVIETTRNYGRGRSSVYRVRIENAPPKEDWKSFLTRQIGEDGAARYFAAVDRNKAGKYRQNLPVEEEEIPADFSEYRQSTTKNTGKIRPETERTPIKEIKKVDQSIAADAAKKKGSKAHAKTVEELPQNGAAQTLVYTWCQRTGTVPVSYPVAVGHAKNLAAAGVNPGELGELYDYLAADPFWTGKGFDLGTAVSQLEKFRQTKRKAARSSTNRVESAHEFFARKESGGLR
jgi:hypothetical protein